MVVGTGIDVVEVDRLHRAAERRGRRLIERLFTPPEIGEAGDGPARWERLAARFAGKEAVAKALGSGVGGFGWRDIEIVRGPLGAPEVHLKGAAAETARGLGVRRVLISLTHSAGLAVASAVALDDAEPGVSGA